MEENWENAYNLSQELTPYSLRCFDSQLAELKSYKSRLLKALDLISTFAKEIPVDERNATLLESILFGSFIFNGQHCLLDILLNGAENHLGELKDWLWSFLIILAERFTNIIHSERKKLYMSLANYERTIYSLSLDSNQAKLFTQEILPSIYTVLVSSNNTKAVEVIEKIITRMHTPPPDIISKEVVDSYYEKSKELCFASVDSIQDHHFRKEVYKSVADGSFQKNILRELQKLSQDLSNNWATSIFLRFDENFPQLIRILMVGPEQTPYWNGLFMFDIYLTPGYPREPPKVHFATTGGGSVRFNPNLYRFINKLIYSSGHICLSLLNTWSFRNETERWIPNQSTLLQLVISLQAMVFVKYPYFNEPGYGNPVPDYEPSEAYNTRVRVNCVKYAMIDILRNHPKEFHEVIYFHFRMKRFEILGGQAEEWIKENERRNSNSLPKLFKELTKLMDEIFQ